ncbi:site-2 protease family protein [Wohlfahrtiimonas larvae]|uniref:Site-2 protease family protein n=1 Tax=Wohlfahrtiimonas larvae TaxID=1157986 RepID=A0ABP9MX88_9GAMM|nr:site-2 protease family protein [Wohlfahrtiimonas larvae]
MELDFTVLLLMLVPLVFAITIHEAAHGYMAYWLGDNTAKLQGRLSLSPIRHIDPIGTIAVPLGLFILSTLTGSGLFLFGWAKPVPFDPRNFKNPRKDIALTAFAGPASNFIQAFLWAIILVIVSGMSSSYADEPTLSKGLQIMAQYGVLINVFLMVLNLMPIPPLDGGKIAMMLLPYNLAKQLEKVEPYGLWVIIGLLYLGLLPLSLISGIIVKLILSILGIFF